MLDEGSGYDRSVTDEERLRDETTSPITISERPLAEFKFIPKEPLTQEMVMGLVVSSNMPLTNMAPSP